MGGTSPLATAATIDSLSAVPIRNVLRYVDSEQDYDAITGAFPNFHAIGRNPAALLEFRLNQLRRSHGLNPTPPEEKVWQRFFYKELDQMWTALCLQHNLYLKRTPPRSVRDPFDGVYGTLEAMVSKHRNGNDFPTVVEYPEWRDVLAHKRDAGEAPMYRSPEFRLQVMELACLRHGDKCRAAFAKWKSTTIHPIGTDFDNARTWPAGYTLLLRYAMMALEMVGADASHLRYIYRSPPLFEAYVLNGSDVFEHEELTDPILGDHNLRTVLSLAILEAQPRVVKALLEHRKVNVTARHNQALAAACSMGHMELAKALVACGADLNDAGGGGYGYALPISFVAAMRDVALLDEFLALGAEPNIPGREGEALFLAVGALVRTDLQGFHSLLRGAGPDGALPLPIAHQLMRRGFVLGPLRDATCLLAAHAEHSGIMAELFRHKSMQKNQDAIDTALCIAAFMLNLETIRFLAMLGANMNCCKAIGGGQARSPLCWAISASRDLPRLLATIDLLTRLGADANDGAILDEFLVGPVVAQSPTGDTQPKEFLVETREQFLLLARGGSSFRQDLTAELPPFPVDRFSKVSQSVGDSDSDSDGAADNKSDPAPLVERLTAEEKAYDCAELEDEDYPWGTLFRALLVRGMDPYAWPEKRHFECLEEWSPTTVQLFKEERWKERHSMQKLKRNDACSA
ncbi:hypothetical protein HDU86_001294 [Geranomyces michiganensis]|nr:hypothetical protein HDU86_001294 [Geranomyces michiganensis]